VKPDLDQTQTDHTFALAGLFFSSALYALALSTRTGKRWAQEQTWATVAAGERQVSYDPVEQWETLYDGTTAPSLN
jgi:hypothetical protein